MGEHKENLVRGLSRDNVDQVPALKRTGDVEHAGRSDNEGHSSWYHAQAAIESAPAARPERLTWESPALMRCRAEGPIGDVPRSP
jgi:hypothetical protein